MAMTLDSELEAGVQRKVESGRFLNASDVLMSAMDILEEDEILTATDGSDFLAAIEEGWQQAERGETVSAEEAIAFFAKERATRLNR